MKKTLSLSTALLMSTTPVFAQDAILLDEIVVTSGLTDTTINKTGASVAVLNSDDMLGSTTSLMNDLNTLPGVSLSRSGGLGAQAGIQIRGLNQNYVAVLIDGMDVTDPSHTQVQYDFGGVNGMGVAQVEVLKGSQSTIFGSEAVAGAINLKTLDQNTVGQRITSQAEIGSHNTQSAGIKLEHVTDQGFVALSANTLKTDGYSARNTGAGANEKDPYEGTQIRLAMEHALNDTVTLTFNNIVSGEKIVYDGDWSPLADITYRDTNVSKIGLRIKTGAITHTLSKTSGQFDRAYSFGNYDSQRDQLQYLGTLNIANGTVSFGAETTKETIDAVGERGTDKETAVFAEVAYAINDAIDLSVSARNTKSNDFGTNTSYRVAAVYRMANDIMLRGMASSGFRAPSLYERYGWGGSTDLTPEKSTTQEIGIEKAIGNYVIGATVFQSTVDDLITYNGSYEQKGGSRKTSGLELAASGNVSDSITISSNYTYIDSKTDGEISARVPKHKLVLGMTARITDKTLLSADVQHVAGYKDLVSKVLVSMPDYTVMNAAVSHQINDKLQAYVRVENLADSKYETIKTFNTGGRQVFAGIRASF